MKRFIVVLLVLVVAVCGCTSPSGLKCSYASADISVLEDEHVVLAGFAAREGLSDGIHIPLRTHALSITDGTDTVCVVSNDMMEISPALTEEIRAEISRRSGLKYENILIHNIHTHSAPRTGGAVSEPGGSNAAYKERTLESMISNAVMVVKGDYQTFDLEVAKGTTSINVNRCEKDGPVSGELYAAKFVGENGKAICAFINLACHPVCLGHKSNMVSSDYSGVARRGIIEEWGCEVFQLTGASGNMNPVGGCKDVEHAEEVGATLLEELKSLKFEKVASDGDMKFSRRKACLPYQIEKVTPEAISRHADELAENYRTSFPRFSEDVRGWEKQMLKEYAEGRVGNTLDFDMAALNINGVVFFFTQGEPFCEYQTEARASFPDRTVFFAGYTGGQNSYLPSAHAYKVKKGYEYEIEQMHVYIKAPYPLSPVMPAAYSEAVFKTIAEAVGDPVYNIIPYPQKIEKGEGCYKFKGEPKVKYVHNETVPAEGYNLEIKKGRIVIESSDDAGKFYAMQTVKQLLPAEIYEPQGFAGKSWSLPCCRIEDWPQFSYRGMMLDCGRWFYPKEEVMKFIDMMAMHKQNMFHWHLTEDQGWRIEIKKYPKLTEVGAWRKETCGYSGPGDGVPHGGFYSQDDVREIVAYAAERHVTVIPEIELPGHSGAAIAAYPWLSCTPDEPKEVTTYFGIMNDVFCPSPRTIKFLEDVFTEVLELFPSPYYHIGGDECPPNAWRASEYCHHVADSLGLESVDELQSVFVKHFDTFLRERGKIVIGWDEIIDGDVENTVAMSYRGHKPASKAFRKDMKVILTPDRWCYYCYKQDEIEDIPKNQHIFLTLRKAYTYDFRENLDKDVVGKADSLLVGLEACLWTSSISSNVANLERYTYPRSAALSEVSWTAPENRNWNSFRMRTGKELERMAGRNTACSDAFRQVIINMNLQSEYPRDVELELDYPYADIRYTMDGSEPTADSPLAPYLITVSEGDLLKARGFMPDGTPVGRTIERKF